MNQVYSSPLDSAQQRDIELQCSKASLVPEFGVPSMVMAAIGLVTVALLARRLHPSSLPLSLRFLLTLGGWVDDRGSFHGNDDGNPTVLIWCFGPSRRPTKDKMK
jgi:hypothetical protein